MQITHEFSFIHPYIICIPA